MTAFRCSPESRESPRVNHSLRYDHHNLSNMQRPCRTLPYPYIIQISTTTTVSVGFPGKMTRGNPDASSLHGLIEPLFPNQKVVNIQTYDEDPHPHYLLYMSGGAELALKTSTPQPETALYYERHSLEVEAYVLSLLEPSEIWCIPKLIRCEVTPSSPSLTCLLRYKCPGTPLSELQGKLTSEELKRIDKQLGIAVDQIGQHTATKFGPVHESLLWNAENMLISLPYFEIRHQASRLSAVFDEVTDPRLVLFNISQSSHLIIDPKTKDISGIIDFTAATWGDVLMTDVFENPSCDILSGYGSDPTREGSAPIRLLFYSSYRNILNIVKQYYRNQPHEEELRVRKALMANLASIAEYSP
ncbi:Lethal(2) giant larvae sro7 [Microsporum ferrugineum]